MRGRDSVIPVASVESEPSILETPVNALLVLTSRTPWQTQAARLSPRAGSENRNEHRDSRCQSSKDGCRRSGEEREAYAVLAKGRGNGGDLFRSVGGRLGTLAVFAAEVTWAHAMDVGRW
jgi:hypothetical protein